MLVLWMFMAAVLSAYVAQMVRPVPLRVVVRRRVR